MNRIPAKGMLFGEYGVLQNYPAVAITFYEKSFLIRADILHSSRSALNRENIYIKSNFFEKGFISFSLEQKRKDNTEFFYNLLLPWKELLRDSDLYIEILESFAPSLGFGSSSAIIAGVSIYLYEYFYKEKHFLQNNKFWKFVRSSLCNIQGGGSGYDLGVQISAMLEGKTDFNTWYFKMSSREQSALVDEINVPQIKKLNIPKDTLRKYGCFLKTNIYSDTQKALNKHFSSTEKNYFAQQQGLLSLQFIENHSVSNLKLLMEKSQQLAKNQGLFPEDKNFQNLVGKLQNNPYKLMGAGFGDCLWVLCTKAKLVNELNFLEKDIAFVFEDIEN